MCGRIIFLLAVLLSSCWVSLAQADEPHAVLVTCVDPRHSDFEHLTALKKIPRAYHFTFAGCSKCLVENEESLTSFLHQLEALRDKGVTFDEIDLVDHTTCRAYDGDDSQARHEHYLQKAAALLQAKVQPKDAPRVTIRLWVYNMETRDLREVKVPATEAAMK